MIKVIYDNNGVPRISILTPGGYADIPWDASTDTIDWEKIEYPPRRESIKASWDNYVMLYNPDLNSSSDRYLFKVNLDFAPVVEMTAQPNWDGFYDGLIMSETYNYLLQQTVPNPSISGVMAVMGFAIKDGQSDPGNPNRLAALQAAINAVLGTLNAIGLPLSESRLAEVRGLLDVNGFEEILL